MPWVKSFDRDAALDKAKNAFWTLGYEGTSLDTLLSSMGIQKGSFYATYESKHAVFLEALNRYIGERFREFEALRNANGPLAALEQHLAIVVHESTGPTANRGCFLVNASLELSPKDASVRAVVKKALSAHEQFYLRMLEAAKRSGDLPSNYPSEAKARTLLAMVLGLRVMARAGASPSTIRAVHSDAVRAIRAD
jgi:TetR/AcrR family transcriptional regulator, transcriptional repressor for nem operon